VGTASSETPGREAWRLIAEMWFGDENHDRFHQACAAADLTPPLLKALLSLEPNEAKPMRVLAEGWACDASWVTGIVDGLEERGYAERQVLPTDRRVKVVQITSLGEKAKAKALERLYEPPPSMVALDTKEQRALAALLRKLHRAATET
jgi:DNA-binding MarR family transcriptional regulator